MAMLARSTIFLKMLGLLAFLILVIYLWRAALVPQAPTTIANAIATTTTPLSFATTTPVATTSAPQKIEAVVKPVVSPSPVVAKPKPQANTAAVAATTQKTPPPAAAPSNQATRIQNPYSFPAQSSDQVNTESRAALVNILCLGGNAVRPISGSGVIIDPRGVILTNAHVAQYVLLAENPEIHLSCQIRTGSPAKSAWNASVLFIPPTWVGLHAAELNTSEPRGTGEHDYALLLIQSSTDGTPLPATFPSLPFDTRQAIGFTGDQVLVASYPAEFLGGLQAENSLYADTSVTAIGDLLTFAQNSVDAISLGGVIEAQSGSSGGGVVNPWGRLIGIITTTSQGDTTAARDLHAITLSYINGDLAQETGFDLPTFLQGDLSVKLNNFNTNTLPDLMQQYIAVLSH